MSGRIEIKTFICAEFEAEYFSFGNGTKPFMIIPGVSLLSVMLSADAIANAYEKFTDNYKIFVFDRRKNLPKGHSIKLMADDMATIMKSLNIENSYIFGASQGGMIALYLAINYPELVKKVVVGSAVSKPNKIITDNFIKWCAMARAGELHSLNMDMIKKIYSKEYREKFLNAFIETEKSVTKEDLERFANIGDGCITINCYDDLEKIKCPILVIGSTNDNTVGAIGSTEIAEKLGCEIFMYDTSHAAYDEMPDYKARIMNFFEK